MGYDDAREDQLGAPAFLDDAPRGVLVPEGGQRRNAVRARDLGDVRRRIDAEDSTATPGKQRLEECPVVRRDLENEIVSAQRSDLRNGTGKPDRPVAGRLRRPGHPDILRKQDLLADGLADLQKR